MTRSIFYIHMVVSIIQFNIYVCNKSDYKIILTVLYSVHGAGLGSVTTLVRFELVGRINSLQRFTIVRGCVEKFYLPRVTSFLSVLLVTACVSICFITIVYARRVSPTRVISDTRNS